MGAGDILLGGGITLAGTVITQVVAVSLEWGHRREARTLAVDQYDREALSELQRSANAYRTQLVTYHDQLLATGSTTSSTEADLRTARMAFQSVLHRVDSSVAGAMETWLRAALAWTQQNGSAAAEERLWNLAAQRCGAAHRQTLR